jgi:putative transposase
MPRAYSTDLRERVVASVFAKIKHLMRQAAERTLEATWRRLGDLLDRFSPDECARYFQNAGYAST